MKYFLNDGKEHLVETYSERWEMYLHVTSSPLYDDEDRLIGGAHVARGIIIQKETEKALRESEEKGDFDL